ncbi:MAG: 1-deoxy-D-xylulose-5-phosphate reductoisomerase [Syntrophales bacterium]|jgi:1-deoxy-D-xylulose-5-phosphate reductoisomerase
MKTLTILGSTGSIGQNTLEVVRAFPGRFKVAVLAAGRNVERLKEQIIAFRPRYAVVADESSARRLKEIIGSLHGTKILSGPEGYNRAVSLPEVNLVVSAIVGAAGLLPTLAALEAGKDVALANKEAMVTAGSMMVKTACRHKCRIIPIDSEHSAIFQCLKGQRQSDIERIILTASGGPFWRRISADLDSITPAEALRHPKWRMGKKVTIDSATLMNKGLEVIEARWFFGVDFDRIDVHIHPQSIVHSLVEFKDGAVIAQLGVPDMRGPIAYALSYPERMTRLAESLDLTRSGVLEFFHPNPQKFPCLDLAYKAGRMGGIMPAALNAANEEAVDAFLAGKILFTAIPRIIEVVMSDCRLHDAESIDDIIEADRWARQEAKKAIVNK